MGTNLQKMATMFISDLLGKVLKTGVGTGRNLQHYHENI